MGKQDVQVQDNIVTVPVMEMPELKSLGYTFFYKMQEHKDMIAQIDGLTGKTETFGSLLQRSIRTAIAMRARGIKQDDIVSFCAINSLECYVPYIASLLLGARVSSLDPSISLNDTKYLLKLVTPKMLFISQEATKLIEDALRETEIDAQVVIFGDTFSEFLKPSPEENDFVPVEVNVMDTAQILFSSGTTGLPKGICLNHYGLLGSFYQKNYYIVRGDVLLTFSPLYWVSASVCMIQSVMTASSRLIYPKYDSKMVWDLIKKYKVNMLLLAPIQLINMCKNGPPEDADTSSLRFLLFSGGALTKEKVLEFKKYLPGTIIGNAYGQTELCGGGAIYRITLCPEDMKLYHENPHSPGRPVPGSFCKIVDPETEELLGPNQEGELRIKTQFQMNGYYNTDSSSCWDSDGFMKTGDIAYYDKDYCFWIVDRLKETFKFQAWHISPVKLENLLLSHPAVHSAVVIGLPHPVDGDHPMGIVVLKENALDSVRGEELEKYVEERVDDRQRLRGGVKVIKKIPVTPSGKISRRNLKDLVLKGEFQGKKLLEWCM